MTTMDPDFTARVRASFERQRVMTLIGAEMTAIAPGRTEIVLPVRDDLTHQHGFVHAGIVATRRSPTRPVAMPR